MNRHYSRGRHKAPTTLEKVLTAREQAWSHAIQSIGAELLLEEASAFEEASAAIHGIGRSRHHAPRRALLRAVHSARRAVETDRHGLDSANVVPAANRTPEEYPWIPAAYATYAQEMPMAPASVDASGTAH